MNGFVLFLIIVVILFIVIGVSGSAQNKKCKEKLESQGYSVNDFVESGKYIAGHPEINDQIERTTVIAKKDNISIFKGSVIEGPEYLAKIDCDKIKDIKIEDASTIEKRITAARLLAVGIFALAWKKKKVNEVSFCVIEWNDGKFDHETIFEFSKKGAMQNANTFRNNLINIIK